MLGEVTVVAGNGHWAFKDGSSAEASFHCPRGLALDQQGRVLVADCWNHRVRALTLPGALRLQQELSTSSFPSGCSVARSDRDLFEWKAELRLEEKEEGPFGKGPFKLILQMPFNYPEGSPIVKFLNPPQTLLVNVTLSSNPHIDAESGEVVGLKWNENKSSMAEVLQTVRAMIISITTSFSPAPDSPVGPSVSASKARAQLTEFPTPPSIHTENVHSEQASGAVQTVDPLATDSQVGASPPSEQEFPNATDSVAPATPTALPAQLPTISEEELTIEEKVGEGSFSVVRRAIWRRTLAVGRRQEHAIQVAVKMSNRITPVLLDELERDLAVISGLPHQNILTLHGVCEGGGAGGSVKVVYELMSTDLSKLLKSPTRPRSNQFLLRLLRDISAGLAHLHAHGVVHRDVKPANVLLRGEQHELVKLCDFGSSKDLQQSLQPMSVAGTLAYMAPEVLNGQDCGKPIDVWSFGVLLFECVAGRVCSRTATNAELSKELAELGCLPALVQLFEKCHQAEEPRKRPSMAEIYALLQRMVMQEANDSQQLKEELRRAEAQDHDTYGFTWADYYANQPHTQELLDYASGHASPSELKVRQPLQQHGGKGSMEELENLANAHLCARLHASLKAIVEECGGTYLCAPRKSSERCVQKVKQEYKKDYGKLLDLERATGLFEQADDMLRCVKRVQGEIAALGEAVVLHTGQSNSSSSSSSSVRVVRLKDRMNVPLGGGYRDLMLNVRDQESGFVAELQLNFHKIAQIKSQTHRFYELKRVMKLDDILD